MELLVPELINKESIPKMNFEKNDVLEHDFERETRNKNLFRAMVLGNTYKQKVQIIFESTAGPKVVETTIWATTEDNALLKDGINLPIRTIREINFVS